MMTRVLDEAEQILASGALTDEQLPFGHRWELASVDIWSPNRFHVTATCGAVGCDATAVFAFGFSGYNAIAGGEVFDKAVPNSEGPEQHMELVKVHTT